MVIINLKTAYIYKELRLMYSIFNLTYTCTYASATFNIFSTKYLDLSHMRFLLSSIRLLSFWRNLI